MAHQNDSYRPALLTALRGHHRLALLGLVCLAALVIAGCDDTPTLPAAPAVPPRTDQASAPAPGAAAAPAPGAVAPGAPAQPASAPAAAVSEVTAPGQLNEGAPAPGSTTEKAQRGVGDRGSKYGGGIITEPVRQYWLLRDATVFEIQIPHAINLFHAEHDRYPKDWAEFKLKIIDPASIQLPDLRPGDKYVYDGKSGELLVEHPRTEADREAMMKEQEQKSQK